MSFETVVLLKRFHLPECTAENDAVSVRIVAVLRKSKISQFLNGTKFMTIIFLNSFLTATMLPSRRILSAGGNRCYFLVFSIRT